MPFSLNAVNGEITQTGTDTNISGLMGIAGVTATVYGAGSNTRTFYSLINSLTISFTGVLTWDTDFEAIIPAHSSALRTTRATFLIRDGGIVNYGLKADGTGSTSAGIYFTPSDDPVWFSGAIQPVITGTSFVVTGANSQFNAFGGQIVGSHTGSYLNNAQGNIANLTVTLNSLGRPDGQDFLYRLYSPNMTLTNLNIRYGSVSLGTTFAGSIITTTRTDGQVGLWVQTDSGNAVVILNSTFSNNDVDIATWHQNGANATTAIVENSSTGTLLNIRGGEVGANVIINNAGYIPVTRALAFNITDPSGVGVNDTTVLIVDRDNGNRKNLNNRDDTIDNVYIASIRDGALDNWNASGGSSATIARSGSVVLGIVNVVRSATNERGTSNTGIYRMDLRGLTDVQGEDTFRFLTFGYRYLPSVDDFGLAGRFVFRVTRALVVDNSITEQDMAVVLAYEGIDINHQTQTITISRTMNLEQLVDFMKANKITQVRMPTDTTILYERVGTEINITYNLVFETGTTFSGTSKYDTIRTTGTITGLDYINRENLNAFDSTFDSSGRIIPFSGYTVITIYMTASDALARTNILFEGNILFYDSSVFGGSEIFIRAEVPGDQDAPLIGRQAVPVGAGSYEFTTLRFSREDQFDTVNDTLAIILQEVRNSGGISQGELVNGVWRALRTTEPLEQREIPEDGSFGATIDDIASQTFPLIQIAYFRSNNVPSGITETGSFTNTYTAETTENATGSIVVVTRTAIGGGMTSTFTGFRYDHHSNAIDFLSAYALGTPVTLAMDVRILQATTTAIASEVIDFRVQTSSSTTNAQFVSRNLRVDSVSRTVYFDLGAILNNSVNFFALVMFFNSNSPVTQVEISRFRITTRQEVLSQLFTDRLGQTQLTTILDNSLSGKTYPNAVPDSIAEQLVQTRNSVRPYLPTKTFDVRPRGFVPINPQNSFNFSHSFVDGEELMIITKTDAEEEDGFTLALSSNTVSVTEDDTFSMTIRITETNLTTEIHEPIMVRANFIVGGTSTFFENSLTIGREPTVLEFRIVEGTTEDVTIHSLAISSTGQNEWRKLELAGLTVGRRVYVKDVTKDAIRDVLFEESPDKYIVDSMFGFVRDIYRGMNPVDNVASLNLALRELVPVNPADNFSVTLLGDELNIWYTRQDGDEPITSVTVFFAGQPFRLTRNQTIMMRVEIEASVQENISVEDFTFILRTRESADETLTFTKEAFVGDTPIEVAFITGLSRETITVTELVVMVNDRTVNIWEHLRLVFGVFQTDEIAQLVRANGTSISTLRESLQGVASLTPTSNV